MTQSRDWFSKGKADARDETLALGVTASEARHRAEIRREVDPDMADYWAGYALERTRMEVEHTIS